jgi:hypothetical protein
LYEIEGLKTAPPIDHSNAKPPQKPPVTKLTNNIFLLSETVYEQEVKIIRIKYLYLFYDIYCGAFCDVISAEPNISQIISCLRSTSKVSQLIDR